MTHADVGSGSLLGENLDWDIILESISDWVSVIDINCIIQKTNRAGKDFTGLEPEEIQGKHICQLVHGDGGPIPDCPMRKALESGKREVETIQIPNGGPFVQITASPIFSDGEITDIVHIVRDVTERKKAEEAILTQAEVTKNMAEGAYIVGLEDVIIHWASPKFEELFGYEPGEMIGKHASIVNAPTELSPKERADDIMEVIRRTGEWHGEVNNIKKDGAPFWCSASVSTFTHSEYGEVLLAVHTDITERKKLELAIKQSEALLNATEQLTKVGGWEWDVEKQTMFWTDEVYRIHDFEMGEFTPGTTEHIERSIECYDPDDRPVIMDAFRNCAENGISYDLEFPFTTASGRRIWIRTTANPVLRNGNVVTIVGNIVDITERKIAKDALKENERRFRLITENMEDEIWLMDMNMNVTFLTPSVERYRGYSLDDMQRMDWTDHLTPESLEVAIDALELALTPENLSQKDKEVTGTNDLEFYCKDGSTVWSETTIKLLRNENGEPIGLLGVAHDITERKKAEEALMQEKEKAETYLKIAGVMMVALDAKGNVSLVNKKGCEVLGYEEADILGKSWFENFVPERVASIIKPVSEQLLRGEIEPAEFFENPVLTKDGEERLIAWHNSIIRNTDGEIIGHLSSGEDITDRRKAEEALKESEEKYRLISEETNDFIAILDLDGNFTYVSPSHSSIGYDENDLLGKNGFEFIHPDDLETLMKLMDTALSEPDETVKGTVEYRTLDKDGNWHDVESNITLFKGSNGIPGRITLISRDITERKRAEEALLKKEYYLSKAQEIGTIGTWELDLINNVLIWTDENYRIFGVSTGTPLTYEIFLNCIHPDDQEYVNDEWTKGMKNNDYDIEHRLIIDGQVRWVREKADIEYDEKGKPIMAIGFTQDITKRKRAEELQRVLLDIASSINTCKDLDDLYPVIHRKLSRILDSTNFFIALYNKDRHTLSFPYCVDEQDEFDVVSAEKTNCHYIIRTGEALLANREAFASLNAEGEIVTRDELGSPLIWLGAPLKRGDEVFGVVAVQSYTNPQAYDENDKEVLQLVSHQIAKAIDEVDAEEALRESEEKYRALFENSVLGIYVTTPDGRILDGNLALVKMLGYDSFEELTKHSLEEKEEGFEPEYPREEFKKILELEGEIIGTEAIWRRRDGTRLHVRENARTIRDEDGNVICYEGTLEDITEKKLAEMALQESEERYRSVFESTGTAMIIVEEDMSISLANDEIENLFGYSKEEAIGRKWVEFVLPEDLVKMKEQHMLRRKNPEDALKSYEFRMIDRKGDVRTVLLTIDMIPGTKRSVASIIDITDRKKAELALKESEEKLTRLVGNVPGAIYRCRNDVDWTMEYLSPGIYELTEYRPEEILENGGHITFSELIHPDDRGDIWKRVQNAIKNRQPFEVTYRIRTASGKEKWMWERGVGIFDADGSVEALEGLLIDITEQKVARDAIRESEEKFRSLFENAGEGILLVDIEGIIQAANPEIYKICRCKSEELIGKNFMELARQFNLELKALEESFQAMRSGKSLFDREWKIKRKDGEIKTLLTNITFIKKGGEVEGFTVLLQDITERKKAEQELKDSEENLRTVLDSITPGVLLIDPETRAVVNANTSAARIMNTTEENIVGQTCDRFFCDVEKCPILDLGWSGDSSIRTLTTADGQKISVLKTVAYITIKGKEYLLETFMDISTWEMAEEAIKESEEKFRKIFTESAIGIALLDNSFRISSVNPYLADTLGYCEKELLEKNIMEIIHPNDREKAEFTTLKVFRDHIPNHFEKRFLKKNGEPIWAAVKESVLVSDWEEKTYCMAIIENIDQRKRTELELRRSVMRHDVESGTVYLVPETSPGQSVEAFKGLLRAGFNGLVLSRTPESELPLSEDDGFYEFFWISEKATEGAVLPKLDDIEAIIEKEEAGSAVLVSGLDFLVTKAGAKKALSFVQHLRELAYLRNFTIIIGMDSDVFDAGKLSLFQKETKTLESKDATALDGGLLEIVRAVYEKNIVGVEPTYSVLGEELKLSKPTVRKRIRELTDKGYLVETTKGRTKRLKVTDKGKWLF